MTSPDDATALLRPPVLTPAARRIANVAGELFYRRGIHAVGVDTIAAESGVTKRTLYDRFGSKDALVVVYLQRRHEAWWERFEARLAAAPLPRSLAVFDSYLHDVPEHDRGCGFLNAAAELPRDHPAAAVIRLHKRAVRARLGDLVRADRPDHQAPDTLRDHLFLVLEGAIAQRGLEPDDASLLRARAVAERLLDP